MSIYGHPGPDSTSTYFISLSANNRMKTADEDLPKIIKRGLKPGLNKLKNQTIIYQKGGIMKRLNVFAATLIFMLIMVQLAAGGDRNENKNEKTMQLVNETKFDISSVQISPADKNQWGDNILVRKIFRNGEKEVIKYTPEDPKVCKYDIKATKSDGKDIIFKDLNLCHLLNVTLYFENQNAYLRQNMIIENQTGFTISELYVSPAHSDFWSNNILNDIALNDGYETCVSFTPDKADCFYDMKVIRLSGVNVFIPNIIMCRTYKVTLYWGEGVPYYSFWNY